MSERKDDIYVAEIRKTRVRLNREAGYIPEIALAKALDFARNAGLKQSRLNPITPRVAS
ncbi:MAG: hypothetical protein IJQ34_03815 [Kiritimatiellae bacterium]|nr:hypothetical protein [Kiritimatiellia bacterium]